MSNEEPFITQKGDYRSLLFYQKAECIYDITWHFAHTYLEHGDRTIDQMVQSARSGKQNIAEGAAAGTTSTETELKLTNVAKASLQELLIDYEDYLRVRGLHQWQQGEEKYEQTRAYCRAHSASADYREAIKVRSDEAIANIAIVLIHQTDYLMQRYFNRLKKDFLEHGGIREEMNRARREYRMKKQGY